jgi:hypothetical protein
MQVRASILRLHVHCLSFFSQLLCEHIKKWVILNPQRECYWSPVRMGEWRLSADILNKHFAVDTNYTQVRTADKAAIGDSSDNVPSSLRHVLCRRSQRTVSYVRLTPDSGYWNSVCDLIALWCEEKKEFPHLTKLAYFIHVTPTPRIVPEENFCTAGKRSTTASPVSKPTQLMPHFI